MKSIDNFMEDIKEYGVVDKIVLDYGGRAIDFIGGGISYCIEFIDTIATNSIAWVYEKFLKKDVRE